MQTVEMSLSGTESELLTPSELNYVIEDTNEFADLRTGHHIGKLLEYELINNTEENENGEQINDAELTPENAPLNFDILNQAEMLPSGTDLSPEYDQNQLLEINRRDACNANRPWCDSTVDAKFQNYVSCFNFKPGELNFQLFLQNYNVQGAHKWVFSSMLNKVFTDIDKVLAIQFKWDFYNSPVNRPLFVRALPVYESEEHANNPVIRCPVHVLGDNPLNTGFEWVHHVLRCEHSATEYQTDISKKRSCITPLDFPQAGTDTVTLTYKFVCKTSCSGGMDRKPIVVLFTLEDSGGYIYGIQKLAAKICSCPRRDKEKEEKQAAEYRMNSTPNHKKSTGLRKVPCAKKEIKVSEPDAEGYRDIRVTGLSKRMYRYLLTCLYDNFKGRTDRLNLTDTADILNQLQVQLHNLGEGED